MTRDNAGRTNDWRDGEPGKALAPADVVSCRECGGLVRRVNNQHLRSRRCKLKDPDGEERERNLRDDHPTTVAEYKEKHPDAPLVSPREKRQLSKANADPEVSARRRELVKARWRGEQMGDIVERLADQYEVSENTVWRDWTRRGEWIERAFDIEDADAAMVEVIARHEDAIDRMDRLSRRAESQGDVSEARRTLEKVMGALGKHADLVDNIRESADEMGLPSGRVEVSGTVEHEHRGAPGEELDDEILQALDEEGGEVIDARFREVSEEPDMNGDTDNPTEDSE